MNPSLNPVLLGLKQCPTMLGIGTKADVVDARYWFVAGQTDLR